MIKVAICRKEAGTPIKRDIVKDVISQATGKDTPLLYLRILKDGRGHTDSR